MTTGSAAKDLVDRYVGGWLRNDEAGILDTLARDIVIVESHGPTYRGLDEVRTWIHEWIGAGNAVTRWDVTSFVESGESAAFEWEFECAADGVRYRIAGMSAVRLAAGRIASIHEYRLTGHPDDGPEPRSGNPDVFTSARHHPA